MNMKRPVFIHQKKQKGAVLIVALVVLLLLTILGVALLESSVVEERMAGNYLDRNQVFQSAEFGLREAESYIARLTEAPIAAAGGLVKPLSEPSTTAGTWWMDPADTWVSAWWATRTDGWWLTNGTPTATSVDMSGTLNNPRYVIEEYDEVCDVASDANVTDCVFVFRITTIAWGGRNTSVMLQSLYSRRF